MARLRDYATYNKNNIPFQVASELLECFFLTRSLSGYKIGQIRKKEVLYT